MIYFIQDALTCRIKIGYTDGDPRERLKALQVGNPSALVLLASTVGDKTEEHRLHELFAHVRERGEWFRPIPELIVYLLGLWDLQSYSRCGQCGDNVRKEHLVRGRRDLCVYYCIHEQMDNDVHPQQIVF